jgi:hypothetical protein
VAFGPPTAAGRASASLVVYLKDRKGGLVPGFSIADKAHVPYAMAAGDLNKDGKPEIVLSYATGPHAVFFDDGTGRGFRVEPFGDAQGSAYGFALGDVDGNGWPDIALARSGAPNVLFLSRAAP